MLLCLPLSCLAKDLSLFETDQKLIEKHIHECLEQKKVRLSKKTNGEVVLRWKINDNGHVIGHMIDHKKSTIKNQIILDCVVSSVKDVTYSLGKTNEIRIYKQGFRIKRP